MAIVDFKDKETEKLWRGKRCRFPSSIHRRAMLKLTAIHIATEVEDLRVPPGNHLELLSGDRSGQSSIRINQQWRICFTFNNGDAYGVEIVDYH